MQRNVFLVWVDAILVAAIDIYQKYFSPRKGWRCAYGALHGGLGCSGFAKSAIQAHGWRKARPLVRNRFQECKFAAQQLREFRAQNGASAMTFAAQPSERKKRECLSDLACDFSGDGCADAACDHLSCDGLNGDFCACSW